MLIAEHSMCHPGKPAPQGVIPCERARPGSAFSRRAKVGWIALVGIEIGAHALPLALRRHSRTAFPYPTNRFTA